MDFKMQEYHAAFACKERIEKFISPREGWLTTKCWEWQLGCRNGKNNERAYGEIVHKWVAYGTHRLAWIIKNNRHIPDGMHVCHRCHNPKCCNPSHLYVGTAQDNADDRIRRREIFGEEAGETYPSQIRLTRQQKRELLIKTRNATMNLYSCRAVPGAYALTKFDADHNPIVTYHTTSEGCDCPQGQKGKACKHMNRVVPKFRSSGHVGDGFFLNADTGQWFPPLVTLKELTCDPTPPSQTRVAEEGGGATASLAPTTSESLTPKAVGAPYPGAITHIRRIDR